MHALLFTPPGVCRPISITTSARSQSKFQPTSFLRRIKAVPHGSLETSGGGGSGSGAYSGGPPGGNGGGNGGNGGDGPQQPSEGPGRGTSLVASYLALLERRPLITKCITCALLNLLADIFCQLAVERAQTLDPRRAASLALVGGVTVAPFLHFWYLTLDKVVTGQGLSRTLKQLFLDQVIFSPISIAALFSILLALEGRPQQIEKKLRKDWLSTVIVNWKVWIPFQLMNFSIVPQQLQVAAVNVVGVAWTIYLSHATHKED